MLLTPYKLGQLELANRIVMAPMTRSRAGIDGSLKDLMVKYYEQRATAGLIITEGIPISDVSRGFVFTPGIYQPEQIDDWKKVTETVHRQGGKIFAQLWHVGRVSHTSITGGEQPVAPSAIKGPVAKSFGPLPEGGYGFLEQEEPREMTLEDIAKTQQDFVQAAKNAIEAGFDGIELHAANSYLFEQFMLKSSNHRTDEYGGSQENRIRFLVETVTKVAEAIGPEKTAFRQSPYIMVDGHDVDPEYSELTLKALAALNHLDLAYVHFSENVTNWRPVPTSFRRKVRNVWNHAVIVAGRYNQESGEDIVEQNFADLVAYGEFYIANPDLVYRFKNNVPLNYGNRATYYGGAEEGLTDYPVCDPAVRELAQSD